MAVFGLRVPPAFLCSWNCCKCGFLVYFWCLMASWKLLEEIRHCVYPRHNLHRRKFHALSLSSRAWFDQQRTVHLFIKCSLPVCPLRKWGSTSLPWLTQKYNIERILWLPLLRCRVPLPLRTRTTSHIFLSWAFLCILKRIYFSLYMFQVHQR